MRNLTRRGFLAFSLTLPLVPVVLSGCVNQHPDESPQASSDDGSESSAAAETAQATAKTTDVRLVATSAAVLDICDRLDLDLVGIPETDDVPARYRGLPTVGAPMSPDAEIIASLHPDYVLSPNTLSADLQPKYEAAGLTPLFLNLSGLDSMYESIVDLGERFDRAQEASALVDEYEDFLDGFEASVQGERKPSVLLLMGVPGSYMVATENSYVGSLVEQAGGVNVYAGTGDEFLNLNTEDMVTHDPDIILRAAHGYPDEVLEMFAEEFSTNDIWKHFRAVEEGAVYDLPYDLFGMSATMDYPEAFEVLRGYLYG